MELQLWLRDCIGLAVLVHEVEVLGYVLDVLDGFSDLASSGHVSHVYLLIGLLDWTKEFLSSVTVTLLRFVFWAQMSSLIIRFLIKSADFIFA